MLLLLVTNVEKRVKARVIQIQRQPEMGLIKKLTFHFETRADLCELNILMTRLDKDMVSEGDEIIVVRKGHDAFAVFLRDGEEVFQDIGGTLTEFRGKVVEDEVRECFRDSAMILDIVTQDHVVECEECCWSVREVRNNHAIYFVSN